MQPKQAALLGAISSMLSETSTATRSVYDEPHRPSNHRMTIDMVDSLRRHGRPIDAFLARNPACLNK